mmetsp:Transcript_47347/g.110750  ORF Transcript_47347/g.110750 Transcript_47347/m.110750 type:complete len:345 (+) Transcript_47347:39-1073(+)
MAYGLKRITGTYQSNGTGRDWFFVGDFEYRHGRRTPPPNTKGTRPEPPLRQPRGPPVEVATGRLRGEGAKVTQVERWTRLHSERGEGRGGPKDLAPSYSEPTLPAGTTVHSWPEAKDQAAGRRKPPKSQPIAKTSFDRTYDLHGQIPSWEGTRYELARAEENKTIGVPRGPCDADASAGPGDHTRGIRGSLPHFAATSHGLGQADIGVRPRAVVASAQLDRDARVHEADNNFKRIEGDQSRGIVGKGPFHKSTLSELGEYQDFMAKDVGAPLKHHFASQQIFFDSPDLEAVKAQEGDECLGIKGRKPHYTTTYSELGSIPKWPQKRYDFGPVANTRYRFTVWRE